MSNAASVNEPLPNYSKPTHVECHDVSVNRFSNFCHFGKILIVFGACKSFFSILKKLNVPELSLYAFGLNVIFVSCKKITHLFTLPKCVH